MSDTRGLSARTLRIVLAAVVAVDLVGLVVFIGDARAHVAVPSLFAAMVSRFPFRVAIALVGIVAIASFAVAPGRILAGFIALIALALLSQAHASLFGSPWRNLYHSGACLLGWIAGLAFVWRRSDRSNEAYARAGATALLGATYFNAGLSKLVYGGSAWTSGLALRETIVVQSGLVGGGLLGALRRIVVDHPSVAITLGVATIAFELGGALFLFDRRVRAGVSIGLIAMHLTIFVLTGIAYIESIVLLAVFGWPAAGDAVESNGDAPTARVTVRIALALGAACVVGVAYQSTRWRSITESRSLPQTAQPARDPDHVGPFRVGAAVGNWTLESAHVGDDALLVGLRRDSDRVMLELTCRPTTQRGPFDDDDAGDARVFYRRTTVPIDAMRNGVTAILEASRAAGRGSVCAAWHAWGGEIRAQE